jgi:hypothetical protein
MAAPKAADPSTLASPNATSPAAKTEGEIARNPFDQPAQR